MAHGGGVAGSTAMVALVCRTTEREIPTVTALSSNYHRHYDYEQINNECEFVSVTLRGMSWRTEGSILPAHELLRLLNGVPIGHTGIELKRPEDCKVMLNDKIKSIDSLRRVALTSADRLRRHTVCHTNFKKQESDALKAIKNKQDIVTQYRNTPGLHPCATCNVIYWSNGWLQRHLSSARHYYGIQITRPQTSHKRRKGAIGYWEGMTTPPTLPIEDYAIDYSAKLSLSSTTQTEVAINPTQLNNAINNTINNPPGEPLPIPAAAVRYRLDGEIINSPVPPAGSALVTKVLSTRKSVKQLEFIVWAHSRGVEACGGSKFNKMSPEMAVKIMRILGTATGRAHHPTEPYTTPNPHGFPTFGAHEILDSGQIKASFGMSHTKLVAQLRALRQKVGLVDEMGIARLLPNAAEGWKPPTKVAAKKGKKKNQDEVINDQEDDEDKATRKQAAIDWAKQDSMCICAGENEADDMVQCNECDTWYHFQCVGYVDEGQGEDEWYCCPSCVVPLL
jgi:hypothetical protein